MQEIFDVETRGMHALGRRLALLLLLAIVVATNGPNVLRISYTFAQTVGKTYYVSPNGNDANNGTSNSSPWRSIDKVNTINFSGGDRILFQGGSTFTGTISFTATDLGSATSPITVSSYGSGRATITSTKAALYAYNTAGIRLTNMNFSGGGRTSNTDSGVVFYTDLAGGIKLDYIHIDNVEVYGFGRSGINIGGWNGDTAYRDIKISYVKSHDNGTAGILTYAENMYANKSVYIGHAYTYNNSGISSEMTKPTGNGIVLGGVDGAIIERSIAYNNGYNNKASSGPVGIWTYDSNNVVIQYNESYSNKTGGSVDGGGFDLDQNVSNSIVQYNYSHGNDGAGYLISHGVDNELNAGNIIRYNISQNDARKNSAAAILLYGRIVNANIYNNSIFLASASSGTPRAFALQNWSIETHDSKSVHVRNNIFYTSSSSLPVVDVSATELDGGSDILFQGNDYYANGSSPVFKWKGSSYSGLSAWRSATSQEKLSGQSTGFSVDPKYASAGNGGTIGNADNLSSLAAYKLQSVSPLINKGLNLSTLFGINPGTTDYYGVTIPQDSQYEVGASEKGSSAMSTPTPTIATTPTPTPTPSPSGAQTASFLPIADAYVQSDTPTTNYGASSGLTVTGGSLVRISFLKFDLSSLAGKHISSAKLRMYVNNSSNDTFSLKPATTNWSETSLTYSNRPTLGSAFGSFAPGSVSSGWVEADVSSGIVGTEGQLFSFGIDGTSPDTYGFYSRNYSTTSQRPQLVVVYQ